MSTQLCINLGLLNRVRASDGVKAGIEELYSLSVVSVVCRPVYPQRGWRRKHDWCAVCAYTTVIELTKAQKAFITPTPSPAPAPAADVDVAVPAADDVITAPGDGAGDDGSSSSSSSSSEESKGSDGGKKKKKGYRWRWGRRRTWRRRG